MVCPIDLSDQRLTNFGFLPTIFSRNFGFLDDLARNNLNNSAFRFREFCFDCYPKRPK